MRTVGSFWTELKRIWAIFVGLLTLLSSAVYLVYTFRDQIPLLFFYLQFTILISSLFVLLAFLALVARTFKGVSSPTIIHPIRSLKPNDFAGISFNSILQNPADCLVVAGSKNPHGPLNAMAANDDWESAQELCKCYGLTNPKADTDITQDDKDSKNLVLIGGSQVNQLTHEVNNDLPIQLVQVNQGGLMGKGFFSTISNKHYTGREFGVVEAIPSIHNDRKVILVAFGLSREGTRASVNALIHSLSELQKNNHHDSRYPARVIVAEMNNRQVAKKEFVE